jgi:hypothetical protein
MLSALMALSKRKDKERFGEQQYIMIISLVSELCKVAFLNNSRKFKT